jgi:hypothetical protein
MLPTFCWDITNVLLECYQRFVGMLPTFCWDITNVLLGYYQRFVGMLPTFCWNVPIIHAKKTIPTLLLGLFARKQADANLVLE